MVYILKGRNVLVTGGSRGLGAAIVRRFAGEGCNVAINYLTSRDQATEIANEVQISHGVKTVVIQGDMSRMVDCQTVVRKSIEELSGLDIIISNAGNTKIAQFDDLHALTEEDWDHAWNVLTKCNVFLLREALPTFNSNPNGGVFLMTSSLGGLVTQGSSMAQSVTRAAGLHLMQCLAQSQGPKVRVNAVCPGILLTERAKAFPQEKLDGFRDMATLKRVTTVEDIAETFVFAARNEGMTGERIRVDSGMMIR